MFQQKNTQKRIIVLTAVIVVILAAVVVFFASASTQKSSEHLGYAMGSEITVIFYGNDKKELADEIFDSIATLDTKMISRKSADSEIYSLNKNGSLELSEETLGYIKKALEICEESDGALDITMGSLSSLWDFDSAKNKIPEEHEIAEILKFSGYDKISFDSYKVTLGEKQIVDLGALGKGIACDTAKTILDDSNIRSALIKVGGTVMTYSDSEDKEWNIGIRTPDATDLSAFLKISLKGIKFISTSGNYEKFFMADDKLYHHILDPKTGYPVENDLKSVTVISENGLVSDALSTACFVLGIEKSAKLLDKYNSQAIFVDKQNNVYIPDDMVSSCTILNDSYRISSYE